MEVTKLSFHSGAATLDRLFNFILLSLPWSSLNRLRDSESLFSYNPRNKHRRYQNEFFCACKEHSTKKRRKCSNCESQCRRRQYIFWSSVTRERDLTKKVQYWKTLESEKHVNVSNSWYSYDVNHLDVENRFFQGNSDTLLTALAVNSRCRRLLTNSPLARSCAPVIGQHVQNQLVKICFRDMMVGMITTY